MEDFVGKKLEVLEKKMDSFMMVTRNRKNTVWRVVGFSVVVFVVGVVVGLMF